MKTKMTDPLMDLIPPEEYSLKICKYGFSELESDFLCFDECYVSVSELVPKDYTIVDLGCYQAAQCYYFRDFCAYIGVDSYDFISTPGYRPPLRFYTDNTKHIMCNIEQYLDSGMWGVEDIDKTYFIMSAVPGLEVDILDNHDIPNYLWRYPGCEPIAKGINAEAVRNRCIEIIDWHQKHKYVW